MDFRDHERKRIRNYVHRNFPFGNADADKIEDDYVREVLFERQGQLYSHNKDRPSIVVGRRGSGKTAFVKHVLSDPRYRISVEINTYKAFSRILRSVQAIYDRGEVVFAEEIKEVWDLLFWGALFARIKEVFPNDVKRCTLVTKFLGVFSVEDDQKSADVVQSILRGINRKAASNRSGAAADIMDALVTEKISHIENIKEEAVSVLTKNKVRAIVLIDSLDDYRLNTETVRFALEGLMKSVGAFNASRKHPEVRLCLPTELYPVFEEESVNQDKDFLQRLFLHWHAGELISVASHRYQVYLSVFNEGDDEKRRRLLGKDVGARAESLGFIRELLGGEVKNYMGWSEDPVAYVLRHTQLLPRQLLIILTKVAVWNRDHGYGNATRFSSDAVRNGVAQAEKDLIKQVFGAFRYRYPAARMACRALIPELPIIFSEGFLHSKYNSSAKRGLDKHGGMEFVEFRDMLMEIGCLGIVRDPRQIKKWEGSYVEGLFSYTIPEVVPSGSGDWYCLHPMFSGWIRPECLKDEDRQVIYPCGTDPEGKDHRPLG